MDGETHDPGPWQAPAPPPPPLPTPPPPLPTPPTPPPGPWSQPPATVPGGWPAQPGLPHPYPPATQRLPGSGVGRHREPFHHDLMILALGLACCLGSLALFYMWLVSPAGPEAYFDLAPAWFLLSLLTAGVLYGAARGGAYFEVEDSLAFLLWGLLAFFSPMVRRYGATMWAGMLFGLSIALGFGWAT